MKAGDVHITSPAGTDLRFRAGDRPVNLQDGDASARARAQGIVLIDKEIELPAGAIRVAPLEETRRRRHRVSAVAVGRPSGRGPEAALFERAASSTSPRPAARTRSRPRCQKAGRRRPRVPRVRPRIQPAARGPRPHAVDPLLWLRHRRRPAVARRQHRAWRQGRRRLRPLELLHRPDGDRRRHNLGPKR